MKTTLVTCKGLKRSFITDIIEGELHLIDIYCCEKEKEPLWRSKKMSEHKKFIQCEIAMYDSLHEDSKSKDKVTGKPLENTGKSHFQHMLRGCTASLEFVEELEKVLLQENADTPK